MLVFRVSAGRPTEDRILVNIIFALVARWFLPVNTGKKGLMTAGFLFPCFEDIILQNNRLSGNRASSEMTGYPAYGGAI